MTDLGAAILAIPVALLAASIALLAVALFGRRWQAPDDAVDDVLDDETEADWPAVIPGGLTWEEWIADLARHGDQTMTEDRPSVSRGTGPTAGQGGPNVGR